MLELAHHRSVPPDREPPPADAQLIVQAAGGSSDAMHALVDRHGQRLYALAYALLGNQADSEDVVQETFIGAFERIGRFEGRATVKTWLTHILVKQIARHHRREHRRRSVPLATDGSPADPSDGIAAMDARIDVPAMLATLSAEQRQVIVLREMEDMTYQEIADTLDIPRGTVESRLFRARRTLRTMFNEFLS